MADEVVWLFNNIKHPPPKKRTKKQKQKQKNQIQNKKAWVRRGQYFCTTFIFLFSIVNCTELFQCNKMTKLYWNDNDVLIQADINFLCLDITFS